MSLINAFEILCKFSSGKSSFSLFSYKDLILSSSNFSSSFFFLFLSLIILDKVFILFIASILCNNFGNLSFFTFCSKFSIIFFWSFSCNLVMVLAISVIFISSSFSSFELNASSFSFSSGFITFGFAFPSSKSTQKSSVICCNSMGSNSSIIISGASFSADLLYGISSSSLISFFNVNEGIFKLLNIIDFLYESISFFISFKLFIFFSKLFISSTFLFSSFVLFFSNLIALAWSPFFNSFITFAKLFIISFTWLLFLLLLISNQKLLVIFAISSSCKSPSKGSSYNSFFSFLSCKSLLIFVLIILPK